MHSLHNKGGPKVHTVSNESIFHIKVLLLLLLLFIIITQLFLTKFSQDPPSHLCHPSWPLAFMSLQKGPSGLDSPQCYVWHEYYYNWGGAQLQFLEP